MKKFNFIITVFCLFFALEISAAPLRQTQIVEQIIVTKNDTPFCAQILYVSLKQSGNIANAIKKLAHHELLGVGLEIKKEKLFYTIRSRPLYNQSKLDELSKVSDKLKLDYLVKHCND